MGLHVQERGEEQQQHDEQQVLGVRSGAAQLEILRDEVVPLYGAMVPCGGLVLSDGLVPNGGLVLYDELEPLDELGQSDELVQSNELVRCDVPRLHGALK